MNFYGANKGTPDTGLIGVTERGDAGTDFSWHQSLAQPCWAGAVLITKRMSDRFNQLVLSAPKPCIVHCTCTGNGRTWIEPAAPGYETQLDFLAKLIDAGFPAERTVLRIDPIIPSPEFLGNSERVLQYVLDKHIPVGRVRFSSLDQYPHVIKRLEEAGRPKFYPDWQPGRYSFHAPDRYKRDLVAMLSKYPFVYETCAEDWAQRFAPGKFVARGCVSELDLKLLGLEGIVAAGANPQNRNGCHCLSVKGELLNKRAQCPNRCIYCYWKG